YGNAAGLVVRREIAHIVQQLLVDPAQGLRQRTDQCLLCLRNLGEARPHIIDVIEHLRHVCPRIPRLHRITHRYESLTARISASQSAGNVVADAVQSDNDDLEPVLGKHRSSRSCCGAVRRGFNGETMTAKPKPEAKRAASSASATSPRYVDV